MQENMEEHTLMIHDEILLQVEKPARYVGGEINMVKKDLNDIDIRFAFAFPDVYEVGMSHLGMEILYYFLNRREDTYCERVFAPWIDMEEIMRKENIELFALESLEPISTFDFVGFTLQSEMNYTNIVNMLDLAKIPLLSKDRGENHPLVIAGGPCAYNPEPLADIIDFFYIGEGEVSLDKILDLYQEHKKAGKCRDEFLESLLFVDGVYIPKFYDVSYKEDGEISKFKPNHTNAPQKIKKVIVTDIDKVFYPEKSLVPLIETVHNRVTLEVFRGCMRGCRFCQAGYVYRPMREKSPETLLSHANCLIKSTGHEEISLISLSTGDYRDFKALANGLIEEFKDDKVNISLPSLRIDAFSIELMEKIQGVRKSSLTFAPEAGSQRMRDVINKGITEEEILNGSKMAFEGGWNRVKLYFMIGLPTETEDDVLDIIKLGEDILEKYYELPKEQRKQAPNIVLSTSCFIPKPFTPFQWAGQNSYTEFMDKQRLIKKNNNKKQIKYNYHDAFVSVIEGVVSRGDRRLGKAIIKAWELGARFDGWSEHFKYEIWEQAFLETGISIDFYARRERSYEEILPWEHIDIGVSKEFFVEERERSLKQEPLLTQNCRNSCESCGANTFGGGICYER